MSPDNAAPQGFSSIRSSFFWSLHPFNCGPQTLPLLSDSTCLLQPSTQSISPALKRQIEGSRQGFLAPLLGPLVDFPVCTNVAGILPDFQIGNFVFRFDLSLSALSSTWCPLSFFTLLPPLTRSQSDCHSPSHPLKLPNMDRGL